MTKCLSSQMGMRSATQGGAGAPTPLPRSLNGRGIDQSNSLTESLQRHPRTVGQEGRATSWTPGCSSVQAPSCRALPGEPTGPPCLRCPLCNTRELALPAGLSGVPRGSGEMPRKDGIGAKRSRAAGREPDEPLLARRGSLRSRELLGPSPRGESKQSSAPLPSPRPRPFVRNPAVPRGGGAGSRGAGPGPLR